MADSQFLFHKLLVSCFFAGSLCDITSFGLKPGSESLSGASVSLVCSLDRYTGEIRIYKSDMKTNIGIALSKCDQTHCRNLNPAYIFTITGNTVEITIKSLQRATDQKWWTCSTFVSQTQSSEKQFQVTVYTVPSSIRVNGPSQPCDLGQSSCEYTCTTDQCTYPSPTFTWLYVFDDDTTEVISHTTSISEMSYSCAEGTKIYESTLTFQHYEVFVGNTPKTVRFQCYITFSELSSGTRTSGVSQDIVFAVKVSTVQIFDGNSQLTGQTITVVNKEEKLLTCIPGNGNPMPTVKWFIGNTRVSTESDFRFIPDNTHHGRLIYCVADNIPDNRHDAVSNTPVLYVKVKVQFVYIEPAAENVISVIENTPEPAVCTTSAGRPGSTIKWYKNNIELVESASTVFEMASNNLIVTKSTRNINVLRSDSDWTLSCTASNFEDSSPISANNSKQLNVLYPPEHMSLLFNGNLVDRPVIDVIKGTHGSLKCAASSNPQVSSFSWNINQIDGDILTIDDSIQNDQIVNCTARNSMTSTAGITMSGYGSISKKINLQYGALIKRIVVNGKTGSPVIIKETAPVLIACYVDSNPDSTISLFQGVYRLTETTQMTVLFYNISSAKCSDTSQYTCEAENGITNVQQPTSMTVQINVECSPRLAFGVDSLVVAQENTTAVLSLTVLAYPNPTQYGWYRNISNRWEMIINKTSVQITHATLHSAHTRFDLTLVHVKPEDYGEYKLIVDNDIGAPLCFTFVLQSHAVPATAVDYIKVDGSTLAAVAGALGTVLVIVIAVVVILVLIIWRNHINIKCRKEDNQTYEMPNRARQRSTDRTYDIVNQSFSEYENAAP